MKTHGQIIILLLFIFSVSFSYGQRVYIQRPDVDPSLDRGLPKVLLSLIETEIVKNRQYKILSDEILQDVMKKEELTAMLGDCSSDDCMTRVAASLKADYLVSCNVFPADKKAALQLKLIRYRTADNSVYLANSALAYFTPGDQVSMRMAVVSSVKKLLAAGQGDLEAQLESVIRDGKSLPEMVFIKGGDYRRPVKGSRSDFVTIQLSDFYLSRCEVTVKQFCDFLNEYGNKKVDGVTLAKIGRYCYIEKKGGSFRPVKGADDLPVNFISWYGAYYYCKWLGKKTGYRYFLPTETQWEYAAGGSGHTRFPNGDKAEKNSYNHSSFKGYEAKYRSFDLGVGRLEDATPMLVGKLPPNSWGLCNMGANLSEWTHDWFDEVFYEGNLGPDPVNKDNSAMRSYRGGNFILPLEDTEVLIRRSIKPSARVMYLGFRVARAAE